MSFNLITILGPTATGKTKLAAQLANKFNGEIISADSRQVYVGMDIGTGKDLSDYCINGKLIPYHLIDIISPKEEFNLFLFKKYFNQAFAEIRNNNKLPFLAGGTGLYLSSILQNYNLKESMNDSSRINELNLKEIDELKKILIELNPKLHNTTDLLDKERIIKAILVSNASDAIEAVEISSLNIGIMPERSEIKKRITERLKIRLQHGMIEEVERLIKEGVTFEKLSFFGLEYKFIGLYLKGKLNYNDMYQKLNTAIHQFAKRQATWFRKMEREGVKINWMDSPDYDKACKLITEVTQKIPK